MAYTQQNLYFTVATPLGTDKLLFKHLEGEESISDLFYFHVEMLSEEKTLNFSQIVGKNATVTMKYASGHQRYFSGVVTRFVQGKKDARFTTYYADLRPWLWILTLTKNCKIFQNLSVPDIIKKVFDDLGFTDYRQSLTKTYQPREYCVQYDETAFHFVSRLMEDEGIFYFFEHTADKHTLVMADDVDAHKECPGNSTARFWLVPKEEAPPQDVITDCRLSQQVITGKYAVDDFNFETPTTDLFTLVSGKSGNMRIYEYPAGFSKTAIGKDKASTRLESYEWQNKLLEGSGHCFSLVAGYKFALTEHPSSNFNASYILHWVAHSLSFEEYSNKFQAWPAEVPFRPPVVTPKPKIVSTQTAIVVGKAGEEIFTDKYGRIKVQFHWDQEGKNDENSSCWVRVNQGWAGKTWGSLWLPRIGQEVIVSFLDGNPDTPLITGAVYNAQQTVPYPLPAQQSKSTIKSRSTKEDKSGKKPPGFNEVRFEDKKDCEEFYMHAQKDMVIEVLNDQTSTIGNNQTTTVGNDQTTTIKNNRIVTVEEKDDTLTVAKGKRTVTIKLDDTLTIQEGNRLVTLEKGKHTTTIKMDDELIVQEGNRTIKIEKGNETHTVKGNYDIKVDGNLTIEVKGNVTIKSTTGNIVINASKALTAESGTELTNKAGTSLTNQAGTALTNKAGTTLTNKAGATLTNEAGASLTNKANASLTNQAGATMTHKSSAVQQVESSAIVIIKGAIVKIN